MLRYTDMIYHENFRENKKKEKKLEVYIIKKREKREVKIF